MTNGLAQALTAQTRERSRARAAATLLASVVAVTGAIVPKAAHAVDGCLVLLCFAAPSWRAVPQCVPPIRQVLRDLARGRPYPTCAMAGAGNSSSHAWASAPAFCPPQYTRMGNGDSPPSCDYLGAVSISIAGAPFARTWWALDGDTVTDFSPAAKAQFARRDTRFDDDYAAWLAASAPLETQP